MARATGRPEIDLRKLEEEARIHKLVALETGRRDGTVTSRSPQPIMDTAYANGAVQPQLFSEAAK